MAMSVFPCIHIGTNVHYENYVKKVLKTKKTQKLFTKSRKGWMCANGACSTMCESSLRKFGVHIMHFCFLSSTPRLGEGWMYEKNEFIVLCSYFRQLSSMWWLPAHCEDYQLTSTIEDTESSADTDDDGEGVLKRNRKHAKKILPEDFVSSQDLHRKWAKKQIY